MLLISLRMSVESRSCDSRFGTCRIEVETSGLPHGPRQHRCRDSNPRPSKHITKRAFVNLWLMYPFPSHSGMTLGKSFEHMVKVTALVPESRH